MYIYNIYIHKLILIRSALYLDYLAGLYINFLWKIFCIQYLIRNILGDHNGLNYAGPLNSTCYKRIMSNSNKILFTYYFAQEVDKYTGYEKILYGSGFRLLCTLSVV